MPCLLTHVAIWNQQTKAEKSVDGRESSRIHEEQFFVSPALTSSISMDCFLLQLGMVPIIQPGSRKRDSSKRPANGSGIFPGGAIKDVESPVFPIASISYSRPGPLADRRFVSRSGNIHDMISINIDRLRCRSGFSATGGTVRCRVVINFHKFRREQGGGESAEIRYAQRMEYISRICKIYSRWPPATCNWSDVRES